MKKCSLFLILALLLTMFSGVNLVSAAEVPEGYTEIASANDFEQIRKEPSGKYYLTADIELPSTYVPIDNFSGELIGADKTNLKSIKLNINETLTASANVGLFRTLGSSAGGIVIKNIKLTGSVTVSGSASSVYVGALIGKITTDWNGNSEISNIVNEADITIGDGIGGGAGGICGYAYRGGSGYGISGSNLVNKGDIVQTGATSYCSLGGILGSNQLALTNCENYGSITALNGVAAGICVSSYAAVSKCYNAGTITTTRNGRNCAGIVLTLYGSSSVSSCYNIGKVTATGSSSTVYQITSGMATASYYLDLTGEDADSAAMTQSKMKEVLTGVASEEFLTALDEAQWMGYTKIASAEDFEKIRTMPSGKYYLAADIVLPSTYEPIPEFSGELIGADETTLRSIGISITATQSLTAADHERFGLFKKINGGTIKNIKLTGFVHITGDGAYAGALAGEASGASGIINCINEADVTVIQPKTEQTTDGRAAGFVPQLSATGTLNKLINRGIITLDGGYGAAAGIAATVSNTDLSSCENYGAVSGDNAGGILFNLGGKHTMSNCYNAGEIAGTATAGIVTALRVWSAGNTPTLTACYNVGTVKNLYDINPIVATIDAGGTVENCSYLNISSAHDDGKDGTTPLALEQMKALTGSPEAFQNVLNRIYTVTVEQPVNGTLLPSGAFYVKEEKDFSVTANPDDSYRIKDVTANGVSLPGNAGNVYTTSITGDTNIKAEFEKTTQQVPAIAATCEEAFTSTEPVVINGETINEPMGIVFAKVLITDGYELTDYGMEFALDQTVLENGEGTPYTAWDVRSKQGNYGVCFYGSFVEGKTYYARPYAVYEKDGATERVYGTTVSFVPNSAKGEV